MTRIPEIEPVDRQEEVRVVQEPGFEQRQRVVRDFGSERRQQLYRVTSVIWLIGGVLQALLGMRFLLRLMAASPQAGFADFIYTVTTPFLIPFFGLTQTPAAEGMVLEIPTLFAMLVYLFIFWLIVRIVWLLFEEPASRTVSRYERD